MAAQRRLEELETRLQGMYAKGGEKNEYVGGFGGGHLHAGSFAEVEEHEAARRKLAAEVKEAREAARQERKAIKRQAADGVSWTSRLLEGDSARFDVADEGAERKLAQATVGLVTHEQFKSTRERLDVEHETELAHAAEQAAKQAAAAEAAAAAAKKERRKRQRKAETAKLSFADPEDEEEPT